MNKQQKYLNKVVEQLVDETTIEGRIVTVPYFGLHQTLPLPPFSIAFSPQTLSLSFSKFVRNVYGLTMDEIKYVWEQYRNIINNRI